MPVNIKIEIFLADENFDLRYWKNILSFAGSWKNIDEDLFLELTDELPERRLKESLMGK